MEDSLTARRKSWHGQATWLLCIPNINSFTCYSCLIIAYATIIGVQDLEVLKQGNKTDPKDMHKWATPNQSHEMIIRKQFCCWHVQTNSGYLNWIYYLSIRQYKTNSQKSQIHKNCSGSSWLTTTIHLCPCSVLVFIMFLWLAWVSSLSFEYNFWCSGLFRA